MDYEKKLALAKEALDSGSYDKETIEYIFPELKESEDERMVKFIKKQLFNIKKTITENYELDAKLTKAIDWLEKQGEQKSIDDLTQQEAMDIAVAKCFEQGEQKLRRMVSAEAKETMYDKPAWSEEDEMHIRELESLVKQVWAIAERENDKDKIHKMSNLSFFLKTLKPQPKQEWSEEEKARIDKIVDVLDWAEEKGYIRYSDWEDYICYVKSLRPQNTWKPSDEQIIELRRVISGCSYDIEPLVEIEEQLKKLREE